MSTTMKLQVAGKYFHDLAPKVQRAAHHALLSAAQRGVQVIVSQIIPSRSPQPVDRGVYRAGWKAKALEGETGRQRWQGAEIFNSEPHAVFIEEGVRPENVKAGRAMFAALLEWVIRKGLGKRKLVPVATMVRRTKNGFEATSTRVRMDHDDDGNKAMVWAIIGSMKRRGIFNRGGSGLGILRELTQQYLPQIAQEEIAREVGKVLE